MVDYFENNEKFKFLRKIFSYWSCIKIMNL